MLETKLNQNYEYTFYWLTTTSRQFKEKYRTSKGWLLFGDSLILLISAEDMFDFSKLTQYQRGKILGNLTTHFHALMIPM